MSTHFKPRCALRRWCLPQRYSSAPTGTISAKPASEKNICETCKGAKYLWNLQVSKIFVKLAREQNLIFFLIQKDSKPYSDCYSTYSRSRLIEAACPKCRMQIIGRATDMENFLKANSHFETFLHNVHVIRNKICIK